MSRLRANQITNENANGAPNFPHGLTVTGIVTATTSATTMSQIVVGSAVTANSQGIDVTGIVTATSFKGDGSSLTGIDATQIATGNTKVQTVASRIDSKIANVGILTVTGSGANVTGIVTASSFSGGGLGKVLQVVQEHNTSFPRLQTSSTTFVASDFKVTITPTAANSKILVDFRYISNNNGNAHDCYMTIRRSIAGGSYVDDFIPNGTQSNSNNNRYLTRNYGGSSRNEISTSMQILDTPSYTLGQAIEYKIYARSGNSSNSIEIPSSPDRTPVLCFATEIAA